MKLSSDFKRSQTPIKARFSLSTYRRVGMVLVVAFYILCTYVLNSGVVSDISLWLAIPLFLVLLSWDLALALIVSCLWCADTLRIGLTKRFEH